MPTTAEKLAQGGAKPLKKMETDHENLKLSKDQFIAKYRKKAEIEAKVEVEKARLEEEANKEVDALSKVGAEDNKIQKEE